MAKKTRTAKKKRALKPRVPSRQDLTLRNLWAAQKRIDKLERQVDELTARLSDEEIVKAVGRGVSKNVRFRCTLPTWAKGIRQ